MKILVTGATGFIGGNVAKKLKGLGHEVYILIKEKSEDTKEYKTIIYKENLEKLIEDFVKTRFDLVIHCAAFFIAEHNTSDVDNLIKSNILLTTHILEAMKVSRVTKIINTSTSWQHYNNEEYNPVCLYAATKQAAEDIIKFYCEAEQIDCINLTIFDSYGPNDKRKKLINLLSSIDNKLELSPGEQYLDYIYIDDIVDAYLKSIKYLTKENIKGFNKFCLNSDNPLKLKDIVRIYEEVFNKKIDIIWGAKPYRRREVMTTFKNGKRLTNWYPRYSFREGMEKLKNEENKRK